MRECLILAGGLGTRLSSVVNDRPKCLALINGKPFLSYLILFLIKNKIERFVFSLGFKSELIENYLFENFKNKIDYVTIVEHEQLGTGGAIKNSIGSCFSDKILVLNADTFFDFNIDYLYDFHNSINSKCSIALKKMYDFDRYGSISLNINNQIIEFQEKVYKKDGFINTGFILLDRKYFQSKQFPTKFSLENSFLEKYINEGHIYGILLDGDFIDIGIPSDYRNAQSFFQ
jgi:D-glycero-alpha-D-manno-heptose 1-phosphate guanylyltransferase